jgi:molybdopterin-guanine dinucleotide biosynthesis protein B
MPAFLALCGHHNSGKTSLGTFLVSSLKQEGYQVAVVKSSKVEDIVTDLPSKDTWKYREAGAEKVGFFQKDLFTLFSTGLPEKEEKALYAYFLSLFWEEDLVLFEGFKSFDLLSKLWLVKDEDEVKEILEVKQGLKNLIGFVVKKSETLSWIKKELPAYKGFLIEQKEEILTFVKNKIEESREEVLLLVNGKKIPMKSFVEDALKFPLLGFLKSLKGVPEEVKVVEVKIKLS